MCFTRNQSYLNTILLIIGSIYVYPSWRLSILLIFLSSKDLIQALLYQYQDNKKIKNILTTYSWVHICFQPLFLNIFMSHFSQEHTVYWNYIFRISFIYGLYTMTTLNEFDIQNDKDCIKQDKKDDFCSKYTTSYIGKYHLGYKFSRDNDIILFPIIYMILIFIPNLLTKSRILGLISWLFYIIIYQIFSNIGSGEKAAIWCFLSIIYFLPVAIFENKILNIIKKISL